MIYYNHLPRVWGCKIACVWDQLLIGAACAVPITVFARFMFGGEDERIMAIALVCDQFL